MILRLLILILVSWFGIAEAGNLERDKAQCSAAASEQYTWILHMTDWRVAYNTCLRNKLRALSPRYIQASLEAIRLEENCPEYLLNHAPIDLSMLGFEIVNHLTPKEMQNSRTSDTIEYELGLYYQRLNQSTNRVRELRGRQP